MRTCVACRTARPKRELVRIVRTPGGELRLDETGRLAGRGAYLCRDASCWQRADAKGALRRALQTELTAELRALLAAGPVPDSDAIADAGDPGAAGGDVPPAVTVT